LGAAPGGTNAVNLTRFRPFGNDKYPRITLTARRVDPGGPGAKSERARSPSRRHKNIKEE